MLGGRSQDGILGGCGIRVSSQLGHLPGTSGGPRTPKQVGGTPSDWVGRGSLGEGRGRRSGGGMGLAPRGVAAGGEGVNWGTTGRVEDQKGVWPGFPCPLEPPGTC